MTEMLFSQHRSTGSLDLTFRRRSTLLHSLLKPIIHFSSSLPLPLSKSALDPSPFMLSSTFILSKSSFVVFLPFIVISSPLVFRLICHSLHSLPPLLSFNFPLFVFSILSSSFILDTPSLYKLLSITFSSSTSFSLSCYSDHSSSLFSSPLTFVVFFPLYFLLLI